ncbi:hypothetical protein LCGC14_2060440, partial [marine sediment metagenome]
CRYWLSLIILLLIFIILILWLKGYLKFSNWITTSATLGAIFVALASAIIALGIADRPPRVVKFTMKTEVDKQHLETYNPDDLPDELKEGLIINLFIPIGFISK